MKATNPRDEVSGYPAVTSSGCRKSILVLSISQSGISWGVYQPARNAMPDAGDHAEEVDISQAGDVDRMIHSCPYYQEKFQGIIVGFKSNVKTLVPESFYNEASARDMLLLTTTPDYEIEVHRDDIPEAGAVMISGIPASLVALFEKYFGNYRLIHPAAALTRYLLNLAREENREHLIAAHCGLKTVDIIAIKEKKLWLVNTFDYFSPEDFAYYVMNTYQQSGLNPETVPLILSGKVLPDSQVHNIATKYIRHVIFPAPPDGVNFALPEGDFTFHRYLDIIAIESCVSSAESGKGAG